MLLMLDLVYDASTLHHCLLPPLGIGDPALLMPWMLDGERSQSRCLAQIDREWIVACPSRQTRQTSLPKTDDRQVFQEARIAAAVVDVQHCATLPLEHTRPGHEGQPIAVSSIIQREHFVGGASLQADPFVSFREQSQRCRGRAIFFAMAEGCLEQVC